VGVLKKSHLVLLVHYLKPQWKRVGLMVCLLLGSIAFQAGGPQVLRVFIDQVSQPAGAQELVRTAFLFLGVVLAGQAVSALAAYASAVVGWEAVNALRADLLLHCLRLDMRFHHKHSPGEMIQRIDGDVGVLGNFFSQFAVQVAANGLLVLALLALIFNEDMLAGTVLVVYVAVAFRVLLRVQQVGKESFSRSREFQSQAVGFWEEMLTLREDMKPLGALGHVLRRNIEHMRLMFPAGRRSTVSFRAYVVAFSAVFVVGNAIAFAIGAYLYGQGQMTLGGVFLLLAYTNLVASKVGNIANQSNDFQQALIAIQRVNELAESRTPLLDGLGAPLVSAAPAVEFKDVSFAYTAEAPVLRSLSFHLAGGQRLGLLGRTGSGKSTIVRLLFRFYDPDAGAIRLDGVDLRQSRLAELRGAIGMVTQEVQLFHASARENLTLFDERIPDERVLEVLGDLGLAPWLAGLPDGLDTLLTGDASLSAGEAQLLALARVFLQDPRLVILDEASSRLDPATEAQLERAIDRLLEGRTAVVIAHRLHTLHKVDQLLVLEAGRLVEFGSREQLEAAPGSEYNRLLRLGMAALE
jgi:ATP-binding cassette, subfamily B, bacterial